MRILFLSHYFPPEVNAPAVRTFGHCRRWAAEGHEVHVITCVPSHPRGVPFEGNRPGWYQPDVVDGITVRRVWTYFAANSGVARRRVLGTAGRRFFTETFTRDHWSRVLGALDIAANPSRHTAAVPARP